MRRASLIAVLCLSLGVVASGTAAPLAATLSETHAMTHVRAGRTGYGRVRPAAARTCVAATSSRSSGGNTSAGRILLGGRQIGPVVGQSPAGTPYAFSLRGRTTGRISSVDLFVAARTRARKLAVALYSATGCQAGFRLAVGSLSRPKSGAWNTVVVHPTTIQGGKLYWLAVLGSGGPIRFREPRGTGCPSPSSGQRNLPSPPRFWTAGAPSNRCPISAYAVAVRPTIQHGTLSGTTGSTSVSTTSGGTVAGGASGSTSTTTTTSALPNPLAPTAAFTVSPDPTIGQPVTFDGSGSTCVVTPCTYAWDDDGGEPPIGDWPLGSGQVIQSTFTGTSFTAYVRLTVTDALGQTGTVEHNVYVANPPTPPPVNSGAPSIEGTAGVGDQLTAEPGSWSGSPTYKYQWGDCNSGGSGCTSIAGATGSTYLVASSDGGHTIEVTVTATNGGGSASATSGPTSVVPSPPVNSGAPSIEGTADVGDQLTAEPGSWSGSPTYAYQWSDCNSGGSGCTSIAGATGSTYLVASSDGGHTIEVTVTATNGGGSASATSGPTSVVPSPPVNSGAPSIEGTAEVGDQLTAEPGSWSGSPTYAYQWSDCDSSGNGCSGIGGATGATYQVQSSDVGDTIEVTVTASNAGGSASATSGPTAVVPSGSGGGSGGGGGGTGANANLWVSTAGGSCVRQATAGAEVASQDCGSLNAAYQAASCGDVVNIDAGTYSDQNITDNSSLDSCSQPVVFQATPGLARSQVVIGNDANNSVDIGDTSNPASNWTLQNVTVTSNITLLGCEYNGTCGGHAHNVTINNIQGGSLFITASNVLVENSNLGPCYNLISLSSGTNNNGYPAPSYSPNPSVKCNSNIKLAGGDDITFKHNVIHDFLDDDSDGAYNHFECMFVANAENLTIDSNKFYDCQIYAIFIQNAGSGPITIQNNWFWASQGGMGGCSANDDCPAENAGGNVPWALTDGDNNCSSSNPATTNVLIRYNSFDPASGFSNQSASGCNSPGSTWRFVGNILGSSSTCSTSTGAVYEYNLWPSGGSKCGSSDLSTSTNPFVTTGQDGSTLDDLHLTCGTNPANNLVTPNTSDYQLNYDIDGNARNTDGPRDAGASAQASCGT